MAPLLEIIAELTFHVSGCVHVPGVYMGVSTPESNAPTLLLVFIMKSHSILI